MATNEQTLTAGIYRLTRDVVNPKPDRRQRYDWKAQPMWQAGALFYVRTETHEVFNDVTPLVVTTICTGPYDSDRTRLDDVRIAEIIPALEPVPVDSVAMLLHYNEHVEVSAAGDGFLPEAMQLLVDSGKLTLDDVREALRAAYEAPEEK
jgi:hypothetical protein